MVEHMKKSRKSLLKLRWKKIRRCEKKEKKREEEIKKKALNQ